MRESWGLPALPVTKSTSTAGGHRLLNTHAKLWKLPSIDEEEPSKGASREAALRPGAGLREDPGTVDPRTGGTIIPKHNEPFVWKEEELPPKIRIFSKEKSAPKEELRVAEPGTKSISPKRKEIPPHVEISRMEATFPETRQSIAEAFANVGRSPKKSPKTKETPPNSSMSGTEKPLLEIEHSPTSEISWKGHLSDLSGSPRMGSTAQKLEGSIISGAGAKTLADIVRSRNKEVGSPRKRPQLVPLIPKLDILPTKVGALGR